MMSDGWYHGDMTSEAIRESSDMRLLAHYLVFPRIAPYCNPFAALFLKENIYIIIYWGQLHCRAPIDSV